MMVMARSSLIETMGHSWPGWRAGQLANALPCQNSRTGSELVVSLRSQAGTGGRPVASVGPFVLDDAPMPGEQSAGRHDPVQPQAFWQQSRQGGHHGAVGPVRLRAGDLTTQDSDLMTEHQDLDVLRGVAAVSSVSQPNNRTMSR